MTTSFSMKYFQRRPFLRSDHKSSSLEELPTPQTHQYNISRIQSEDRSKQGTPEHTVQIQVPPSPLGTLPNGQVSGLGQSCISLIQSFPSLPYL